VNQSFTRIERLGEFLAVLLLVYLTLAVLAP
jgi:hypothetical protein